MCFALEIQIAWIAQEYSNSTVIRNTFSKYWLSRRYLAWEQSSFGIWIFSHMTESHHFILQGYSNNLYFHIFFINLALEQSRSRFGPRHSEDCCCRISKWKNGMSHIGVNFFLKCNHIFIHLRFHKIFFQFFCKNVSQISR